MHYYSTVDNVILYHSDMIEKDYKRHVLIRFEKPVKNEFLYAECFFPECIFNKVYGFSEVELMDLKDYLKDNGALIWEYSQKGGGQNA